MHMCITMQILKLKTRTRALETTLACTCPRAYACTHACEFYCNYTLARCTRVRVPQKSCACAYDVIFYVNTVTLQAHLPPNRAHTHK